MLPWKIRHFASQSRDVFKRFPPHVSCNICGWWGRRFNSDSWHPFTICPQCESQVRHRLLMAALNDSFRGVLSGKSVLHFAPERVLSRVLRQQAKHYETADLLRSDVDWRVNMSAMPEIPDARFDVIVACDVLEHVANDDAAIQEVRRILRAAGWAILTVPQKDGLAMTFADPSITTPEGRLEAFGQEDHLRIYGDDFPEILRKNGFEVHVVDQSQFHSVKRHVLFPPILSSHPLATNYRRVFFAQKPA